MSWLRKGRVVARHPEDHSVDIVLYEDGARLAGVQVLCDVAGSDTGFSGMPLPGVPPSGNIWSLAEKTVREVQAVVGYLGPGLPVCLGFLFPQINGMTFKDGRWVWKHESGAYTTFAADGSIEQYHPSGSYFRIGTGGHANMAGQDADGRFATRNDAPAPTVTLSVGSGGGSPLASLTVSPTGGVTVSAAQAVAITSAVSVDITAPANTIHGPLHVTGTLQVDGAITTNGDMTAGGKSYLGHEHTEHGTGGGVTGPPI